jgi:hypothetical protein
MHISILLFLLITICPLAEANMIWPTLYVHAISHFELGPIIFFSLIAESILIKWITKHTWIKTFMLACLINLVSAVIGFAYTFTGSLFVTFIISRIFSEGTFSIPNWIGETLFYGLFSSLIEYQSLRLLGRFKFFFYKAEGLKSKAYLAFLAINIITAGAAASYTIFFKS